MKKKIFSNLLGPLLSNPLALAAIAALLVLGGIIWYVNQAREARESEALRARERGRSDSMWNQ